VPLVAIVGPTGSGKSGIGVELARALQEDGQAAEIVSADAMQLYVGMDIGTAKVTEEEMKGVTHHLLDVWQPSTEASVQDYQERARAAIEQCFSRGVIPILVGGSGLYLSSVLYHFEFPGTDEEIRQRLEHQLEHDGLVALAARLVEKDPEAATEVDLNNPRRVVRALEVIEITGMPITPGLKARGQLWHEPSVIVGIEWDRDELIERIDQRVELMWARGLVEEVRRLLSASPGLGKTAAQAIGYREVLDFLDGEIDEAEAKELVAQHTRRYARKQMSWFRRDSAIQWFDGSKPDIAATIQGLVATHHQ
jgi:tRNA dimethylallyltransferase